MSIGSAFGQADRTTRPPSHDIPAGGPRSEPKLILAWLNADVEANCWISFYEVCWMLGCILDSFSSLAASLDDITSDFETVGKAIKRLAVRTCRWARSCLVTPLHFRTSPQRLFFLKWIPPRLIYLTNLGWRSMFHNSRWVFLQMITYLILPYNGWLDMIGLGLYIYICTHTYLRVLDMVPNLVVAFLWVAWGRSQSCSGSGTPGEWRTDVVAWNWLKLYARHRLYENLRINNM